jgi:hypothetical protein
VKAAAKKAIEKAATQVQTALAKSRKAPKEIKKGADAELMAEILSVVAKARKAVDAERKATTKPLRDETDEINRGFNEILGPLEGAEKGLKALVVRWEEQEERRIAKEKAEAEERAAEEQAREDQAAADEDRLPDFVEPEPVKERAPLRTGAGTVSTRKEWDFEIVDEDAIPRKYLIVDEKMLRGLAKAEKEKAEVPGVRFFSKRVPITR